MLLALRLFKLCLRDSFLLPLLSLLLALALRVGPQIAISQLVLLLDVEVVVLGESVLLEVSQVMINIDLIMLHVVLDFIVKEVHNFREIGESLPNYLLVLLEIFLYLD